MLDKTGLSGAFDYIQSASTVYVPAPIEMIRPERGSDDFASSFLNFILELHLKLEKSKGPIEIFVIDHVENPTAN